MSDNVVSLIERRPHLSGPAICVSCKHEWSAVAIVGTYQLECPDCGLLKGVFKSFVYPEEFWVCRCGSWVLMKSSTGAIKCASCGANHEGG